MKKYSTILGLAIGDALGQPFEFSSAAEIIKSGWDGNMVYGDVWQLQPGQWTDDTKMALCIANSLLAKGKFDADDLAKKYVAWVETGDTRGIGNTCHSSISLIRKGEVPGKINSPFQSEFLDLKKQYEEDSDLYGIGDFCGNGTVMRCAPIGLFYSAPHQVHERDSAAIADATMTHNHPDARDSSKFLCTMIADIVDGCTIEQAVCNALDRSYEYNHVPRIVKKAVELHNNSNSTFAHAIELGESGAAHATLATAIFACLKYKSFKEAITASVLIGGDTDTRAAIAGAIAGTYYGLDGIPVDWIDQVEDSVMLQVIDSRLYENSLD